MNAFLRGVLIASLAGCGYTSQYVPPADGRARPLWSEDHLITNLADVPPTCTQAIDWQLHPGARAPLVPRAPHVDAYWAPVYYGPDIVVVAPGFAPIPPNPILFSPSLTLATAVVHASHGGGGGVGHLGGGGGGGGGGKDLGYVLLILAVIAVIVLPALDIGLATARPESEDNSADAIDRVNAYNDLARWAGTPCSYGAQ
jgi:hypothetical protein